jgi:dihydroorotate dehydrogenase electron transfer subunit
MARVISNRRLSRDFFLLRVSELNDAKMGQFCMLRAWGMYPLLSRPISVYDRDDENMWFLCKIVGEGTRLLSALREGDEIETGRVLGNTFPTVSGCVALVGGGAGIAPLHLAAKTLKGRTGAAIDTYLGFSGEPILEDEYAAVSDGLVVDTGGFITDRIDTGAYDRVLACGPEIMMKTLYWKCRKTGTKLHVSLENKMACGIGVCLGCGCATTGGRKKICADGPVFAAEEVFQDG